VRIITACTLALAVAGCAAYQQKQLEQAQARPPLKQRATTRSVNRMVPPPVRRYTSNAE
jgi:hypothetical protein